MERRSVGEPDSRLNLAPSGLDRADGDPRSRAEAEPFESFYSREFARLLALARALVGTAIAEDVVQESLFVAYRKWDAIGQMRSPAGYVHGIVLHKAVSAARRRTRERQVWGRFCAQRVAHVEELPAESSRFWDQVRMLPRRQAQVVALHYALDLPVAEVAQVLDCAEGTVKVHLHRARQSLAATFAPLHGEST